MIAAVKSMKVGIIPLRAPEKLFLGMDGGRGGDAKPPSPATAATGPDGGQVDVPPGTNLSVPARFAPGSIGGTGAFVGDPEGSMVGAMRTKGSGSGDGVVVVA